MTKHVEARLRSLAVTCALIVMAVAFLAIFGWLTRYLFLARVHQRYIPMAPSTAASFLLLGLAVLAANVSAEHKQRIWLIRGCALAVLLFAAAILVRLTLGIGPDLENIFVRAPAALGRIPIGRMSPVTAAGMMVASGSLLILLSAGAGGAVASLGGSALLFLGLTGCLGYLYRAPFLYGGKVIPVALTTALSFVVIGTGIMATAGPECWPLSTLLGSSVRSRITKYFLPLVLLVIVAQGYILGLVPHGHDVPLVSAVTALVAIIATCIAAPRIAGAIGSATERAENELRRQQAALVRSEGKYRKLNAQLEERVLLRTVELRESKRQLTAANEGLKELDRLKSVFIATTSHELRTPLNSVIGFSSLLLSEWPKGLSLEQREDVVMIRRAGEHLLRLVNDIIDISKIEAGKLDTDVEEIELADLASEVTALAIADIQTKDLTLKVDFPQITVVADRARLLQCLTNLISNAAKFTERGSITATARTEMGQLIFDVSDTGIGIKQEEMPKLFNSFQRLESPLRLRTSGTGLGLYLVKKIVEEVLHGTVEASSVYGKGSTFTLHVPIEAGGQARAA